MTDAVKASNVILFGGRQHDKSLVVSVDPGKNIGVALWTSTGVLLFKSVMDFDTLDDFLENSSNIAEIIYEDYTTNPWKKQGGSKQHAAQVIGMLKSHARRRGIDIVCQPNTILRVAALHAGIKVPAKGHIEDDVSALLHGWYYFETLGISAQEMRERNRMV